MKDCKYSPSIGPKSMASTVACILSSAAESIAVEPAMMPPAPAMTCCDTSKTAMVMLKQFVMMVTARKVLKTHLKKIQDSKFARLLWSIIIWINS